MDTGWKACDFMGKLCQWHLSQRSFTVTFRSKFSSSAASIANSVLLCFVKKHIAAETGLFYRLILPWWSRSLTSGTGKIWRWWFRLWTERIILEWMSGRNRYNGRMLCNQCFIMLMSDVRNGSHYSQFTLLASTANEVFRSLLLPCGFLLTRPDNTNWMVSALV